MAYNFASASSQYLESASSPISTYPLTMAAWVRLTNLLASGTVVAIAGTGTEKRYFVAFDVSTGKWSGFASPPTSGSSSITGSASASSGIWTHVAFVVASATSRELYINGASAGTNTTENLTTGMDRVLVGARRNSTGVGVFLNGDVSEVGIYATALSASEIASLADAVSPLKVRPQSLKVYHPLIRNNVAPIGPAFTAYNAPTIAAHPRIFYPAS